MCLSRRGCPRSTKDFGSGWRSYSVVGATASPRPYGKGKNVDWCGATSTPTKGPFSWSPSTRDTSLWQKIRRTRGCSRRERESSFATWNRCVPALYGSGRRVRISKFFLRNAPLARSARSSGGSTGSKWGPANPLGHSLVRDGSPDIDCGNWGKKQPVFHILLCIDTNIADNARRSRHRSSKNRLRYIFE
jgi:hypothetical protein